MQNKNEGDDWTTVVSKKKINPKVENAQVNPNVLQDWDKIVINGKSAPLSVTGKKINLRRDNENCT